MGSSTSTLTAELPVIDIDSVDLHDVAYVSRYEVDLNIPRFDLPKEGVDARVAYQLLHDELSLDGLPQLNLAS